ncbi:MAG: regulatory protein RecX [Cytophagaceae bacterium]
MDGRKKHKVLTPGQAFVKISAFCAYQERAHKEVFQKLYEYGLKKSEAEEIISRLITDNFLNEERFAKSYAGGKFRMKRWGKVKIKRELELKGVSAYCIRKGMEEISEEAYWEVILSELGKKTASIKDPMPLKKIKAIRYMLSRGFENDLIKEAWETLEGKKA